MKKSALFLAILFLAALCARAYDTAKPWTWWWIFGNSATRADITANLEYMKEAGLGGVCVIPVRGKLGDEKNYVPLLSPKFMETLAFIQSEADRLSLGVDMTMGSGWPFGGPWIPESLAGKQFDKNMRCAPTRRMVGQAAPGGEGFAANPFNPGAYKFHAEIFEKKFAPYPKLLRGFFNDSYEYFREDFTEKFPEEFAKRRGYDLRPYARAAFSQTKGWEDMPAGPLDIHLSPADAERVWQDYHQTLAELLFETAGEYARAAKRMGRLSVYQAHGSPGNLIDLYALADIPETEAFGSSGFKFVRNDPDYRENVFGRPNKIMMKFASSAANLRGKKLAASETCTWLANHFKVSPSQIKPELDKLFVGGINHIFYHGFPYTPKDAPFPGRLFYASTNFNFNSHFSEFFPKINAYAREIQSVLQESKPGNDVLLYFPIHSFWKSTGVKPNRHTLMFEVHTSEKWLARSPAFAKLVRELDAKGFCFDFISDAELEKLAVENGIIKSRGGSYKCIVVPDCGQLPIASFRALAGIAKKGGNIVFQNKIPRDVPNFANLQLRKTLAEIYARTLCAAPSVRAGDAPALAQSFGAKRETLADLGLDFIRKIQPARGVYFIANFGEKFSEGDACVSAECAQIEYFNPQNGRRGKLDFERTPLGPKFRLRLRAGESCFIFANKTPNENLEKISFPRIESGFELGGMWSVEFLRWIPESLRKENLPLPPEMSTPKPRSWTELGGGAAKNFCGAAAYRTGFYIEDPDAEYALEFAEIRDAARIKINGVYIGDIWSVPYKIDIPRGVLKNYNSLEVEVSNCSFNYAQTLERKDPDWNKENNLYDITYKPPYTIKDKPLE
ncbi:MAG: hypothetical protein IJI37_02285, partial [Opitutales bacterium]|nr:hypothetical protein [Opitutales bacterium]